VTDIESYITGLRSDSKEEREESMKVLVETGSSALPELMHLLTDPDWIVRYRAAEALGGIGDKDAVDALIITTCDVKDHVRYMATKSLGTFRDTRIHPALVRMLSDDHCYTRRIAASGLIFAGDSSTIPALSEAIGKELDIETKLALESALTDLKKKIS